MDSLVRSWRRWGSNAPNADERGITPYLWWIFFVNVLTPFDLLYLQYQRIAERFPGWTLSEIKSLPFPERRHWINVVMHQGGV
jgi:hypothetical protein